MYFLNKDGSLDEKKNYTENYCHRNCMCAGCCYKKCSSNKFLRFIFIIVIIYLVYKLYMKYMPTLPTVPPVSV